MKIAQGTMAEKEIKALDKTGSDRITEQVIKDEHYLETDIYFMPPSTYIQYAPKVKVYRTGEASEYEPVKYGPWMDVKP